MNKIELSHVIELFKGERVTVFKTGMAVVHVGVDIHTLEKRPVTCDCGVITEIEYKIRKLRSIDTYIYLLDSSAGLILQYSKTKSIRL